MCPVPAGPQQTGITASRITHRSHRTATARSMQGDPAKSGYIAMLLWAKLLHEMPRQKFPSHADFHASCQSAAGTVAGVATHLSANTCTACRVSVKVDGASQMTAALRGHTRRLCEPEEAFFNKAEYLGASSISLSQRALWAVAVPRHYLLCQ